MDNRKRIALIAGFAVFLATRSAISASLVKSEPEAIRDHLAEIIVVAALCQSFDLLVRHNMVDTVWDVLELKTGKDPNDESEVEKYATDVSRWESAARANPEHFCGIAFGKYGPAGSTIPDLVYRR